MTIRALKAQPNSKGLTAAIELAAAVLLHTSFWLTLFNMLGLSYGVIPVLSMVLFPIPMYFIGKNKLFGRYLIFYAFVIMALAFLAGFSLFSKGFIELYNELVMTLDLEKGKQILTFTSGVEEGKTGFYAGMGATILMVLTSAVFATSARYRRMLAEFLVTMVPLLLFLLVGFTPNLLLFSFFLVSLTLNFLLCSGLHEGKVGLLSSYLWIFLLVFIAFLSVFALLFSHYSGSKAVTHLHETIADTIYEWRYAPEDKVDGMPEGDLNNAGALQMDGTEVFSVTLSEQAKEPLYLRSYVGEFYQNGAWTDSSAASQDENSLRLKLAYASRGYNGFTQFSTWVALEPGQTLTMTVENESEYSDRLFAPYEVAYDDTLADQGEVTDTGILSFGMHGKRSYELNLYATNLYAATAAERAAYVKSLQNRDGYEEAAKEEQLYSDYTQHQYLEIAGAYTDMVDSFAFSQMKGKTTDDVTYTIRNLFSSRFTYSDQAQENGDEDPLIYFAMTGHTGYDTHFASLATLLYRSAGIPARYVEGYLLPAGQSSYQVTDTNSHAWVEIYESGFGWIPVEVTPGYYDWNSAETETETVTEHTVPADAQDTEEDASRGLPGFVWFLLILVGILLLAVLIFVAANGIIRKRIATAVTAKDVYLGYRYLLLQSKLHRKPIDWSSKPFARYLEYIYKERYSEHGLTSDERLATGQLVIKLLKKLK